MGKTNKSAEAQGAAGVEGKEFNATLKALFAEQGESGPVYAKDETVPAETVAVDSKQVTLNKGNNGYYLTIEVAGVGTRNVSIRGEQDKQMADNYRIEGYKAIRSWTPPQGKPIIKGKTRKPFAVAI